MSDRKTPKNRMPSEVSAARQTSIPPGGQPADSPGERQTAPRGPKPRSEGQRLLLNVPGSFGEIAAKVGCSSRQTVSDWRSGEKIPGATYRQRLHEEYGIAADTWERRPMGARSTKPPPPPGERADVGPARTTLDQVNELIHATKLDLRTEGLIIGERMKLRETLTRLLATKHKLESAHEMLDDKIVRQHPVWKRFKQTMLEALAPYPEASRAVLEALAKVGE